MFTLGAPGTGKSFVCSAALAHAFYNGAVCYPTSLAARRASQVGGEHIHRLFCIPVKNLTARCLADEALKKLNKDHKRRMFLSRLQVLVVEEISLIGAEYWAAMDFIMQAVKDNLKPFGGIFVIANGDCCQLPNVDGTDIFLSAQLLFSFNFHFLNHHVRMQDPNGQQLLKLLENRPVCESDVDQVVRLVGQHCQFKATWSDLEDLSIMRVFGKKAAEREALDNHRSFVIQSGLQFQESVATDEIRNAKSTFWVAADERVSFPLSFTVVFLLGCFICFACFLGNLPSEQAVC